MFIRVYLQPTFFTKKPRGMFINLQNVNYIVLDTNQVYIYKHNRIPFISPKPITIPFENHKDAIDFYNQIQKQMTLPSSPSSVSNKERFDMASPDSLAMATLDEYTPKELK